MHVFVTGANGFIGQATVENLVAHGHRVTGLVRNEESVANLKALGAEGLIGDITNPDALKKGAAASDGVIHLAFVHDWSNMSKCCAIDRAAITAMADAMTGTGKPLVIASGTLFLKGGPDLRNEDSEIERNHPPFSERAESADLLFKLSDEKQIRGIQVRLSPTVHGVGDKGMLPGVAEGAKKNGSVPYWPENPGKWPAVHRKDAADLFRLALEKGQVKGSYHAVAEQGVLMNDILAALAKKLNLPFEATTVEKIMEGLGFFGGVTLAQNYVSSEKTQKELGWRPTQIGLIKDIEANYWN